MMRTWAFALVAFAGCHGEPAASRSSPPDAAPSAPEPVASAGTTAPGATAAPVASATASARPPALEEDGPEIHPADERGLRGKTIDFRYDAKDVKDKGRAYTGRIFVHGRALRAKRPLPLVVFMHGLNRDLIPHRWMGGGNEGDVRRIVSDLMESKQIPAVILAGPGSVERAAVSGGASFPVFDHDKFVAQVIENLGGVAEIDPTRVVVTGHSGAGCSDQGGIIPAIGAKVPPLAVVSIDTCMPGALAEAMGRANPRTHVLVTWQVATWDRNFAHFRRVFEKETASHPQAAGVLRELDALPTLPKAHDATVKQTFDKWLPKLLGAR